jgi:hypothetical protein
MQTTKVRGLLVVASLLSACGPPRQLFHVVAPGELAFDSPFPAHALWHRQGHGKGAYEVGGCIIRYDMDWSQASLTEDSLAFPDEFRYRFRPLDHKPSRWVTYKQERNGGESLLGPYHAAVYVAGATVYADCETRSERDAALEILGTVRFFDLREPPEGTPLPPRHSTPFRKVPDLCTREDDGPSGGDRGVIQVDGPWLIERAELRPYGGGYSAWNEGDGDVPTLSGPQDVYDVIVSTNDGDRSAICRGVEMEPRRKTLVHFKGLPP